MVAVRPLLKRGFGPVPRTSDSPQVAAVAEVSSATRMRLRSMTGWLPAACGGRSCPGRRGKRPRRSVRGHKSGPRHWLPRRRGCARWRGTDGELGAGGRTPRTGARHAELDGRALRPASRRGDVQAGSHARPCSRRDLRRGRDDRGCDSTDQRLPRRRRARAPSRGAGLAGGVIGSGERGEGADRRGLRHEPRRHGLAAAGRPACRGLPEGVGRDAGLEQGRRCRPRHRRRREPSRSSRRARSRLGLHRERRGSSRRPRTRNGGRGRDRRALEQPRRWRRDLLALSPDADQGARLERAAATTR